MSEQKVSDTQEVDSRGSGQLLQVVFGLANETCVAEVGTAHGLRNGAFNARPLLVELLKVRGLLTEAGCG